MDQIPEHFNPSETGLTFLRVHRIHKEIVSMVDRMLMLPMIFVAVLITGVPSTASATTIIVDANREPTEEH